MRRLPIRPRHIAGAVVLLAVLAGLWYTRPRPLAEFAGQSAMEITAITAQVTRYVEGDTPGAAPAGQRREISLTAAGMALAPWPAIWRICAAAPACAACSPPPTSGLRRPRRGPTAGISSSPFRIPRRRRRCSPCPAWAGRFC